MNKIQYWLTRNYYVWLLVYVSITLPFMVILAVFLECSRVTFEVFSDALDEIKNIKNVWFSEKEKFENRIKKGK